LPSRSLAAPQCLGEHVGKNDLAKGSYAVVGVTNDGQKSKIDVRITGPAEQLEHSALDVGAGKFGFTASESGSHRVCFSNRGLVARAVELEFTAGVDAADYTDLARKECVRRERSEFSASSNGAPARARARAGVLLGTPAAWANAARAVVPGRASSVRGRTRAREQRARACAGARAACVGVRGCASSVRGHAGVALVRAMHERVLARGQ
jgi:hypothetical protein